MAKSCKIERKQKEFLKEMKRKLSCEEDPYCEKLQRAFRSVVVIEDAAKEDK